MLREVCGAIGTFATHSGEHDMHERMPTPADRLLTTSETKERLGCGTTKLYELIANGSIVAVKLGRHTRIRESSVTGFIETLPRAEITTGRNNAA